eukprot:COSAG05_NODE_18894_length_301_cov_0.683168_1_plen_29_part_01
MIRMLKYLIYLSDRVYLYLERTGAYPTSL